MVNIVNLTEGTVGSKIEIQLSSIKNLYYLYWNILGDFIGDGIMIFWNSPEIGKAI